VSDATAPLAGVTVVDLSTRLPGPLATLMLARAGARVVRVERAPHGDETRALAPRIDGVSAHYRWLNEGKETVLLDLRAAADRERFESIVAGADVLIEQFRPGVMDRLGLGRTRLQARHPRLIWCAITGYGQDDARSLRPAHDLNYQADAGLVSLAPDGARGVPVMPTALLGDLAGGSMPAVTNVLLALLQRARTGRGGFVDIAMSRNVEVFAMWSRIEGALTGRWPVPQAGRHTGGLARYNLYRTRDGRVLAVGALEDRFWHAFLDGVGLELPAELERSDPTAAIERVAAHLATRDASHWLERLAGRDACCNLVRELRECADDEPASQAGAGGTTLPRVPLPLAPGVTATR
jgi:crotonobetainyl-CoA:carnitine CoA-transferase CaiB-like acyl-CoA transferase